MASDWTSVRSVSKFCAYDCGQWPRREISGLKLRAEAGVDRHAGGLVEADALIEAHQAEILLVHEISPVEIKRVAARLPGGGVAFTWV